MSTIVLVSRIAKVVQVRARLFRHADSYGENCRRCYYCGKALTPGEWVGLAHVEDEPNWTLCDECSRYLASLLERDARTANLYAPVHVPTQEPQP